jgi:prepilin-type N-terminal cleavage/methylation domain-containing protein
MKRHTRICNPNPDGDQGFTLIELLVVITLISVLVAILLPALSLAKVWSKRVNCQANLRQIAQAWHMYFDDNEGRFYQGRNADVTFVGWRGLRDPDCLRPLNKYLSLPETPESEGQAMIAKCPADTGKDSTAGLSVYTMAGTSYRMNHLMIGPDRIPSLPDPNLTEEINRRLPNLRIQETTGYSRLLLVGDNGWVSQWWPTSSKNVEGWHNRPQCFSLAFMDGHVDFLHIRKGIYIADNYTVIPFGDLYGLARYAQREEPRE